MTVPGERSPGRTLLVGCGKLGVALGERLVAGGQEVLAIRRTPGALPSGFRSIAQDLRLAAPRDLPPCDSIVITLPPDAPDEDGEGIYAAALAHLAEALPSHPSRVLFVSSTRVFEGRPGPRPLTEADAPAPAGPRAHALLDGERLAARLLGARVIRPAGIYGPGRESVIRRVRERVPVDYSRRTNRIHEHDLVRLLDAMLRAEDPPPLVHAVDQAPVPMGEVVTFVADRLGGEAPPRIEPEGNGGTVLDGALMREVLGSLRFPSFREGYAELLGGSD
ncbi:sugar nucleotide-binding protein [Microbacterium azadirachtae]|uniref:sugar nucleotide-binding protein n=1 Tax=Microbacterium azadirachtae TaxID=582680 RepID=UPI0021D50E8A|nr:sugar nucleotide-binding protein [Microbacterium azadirachtae]UXW85356.1 sugar nucleotide-binding protein [Microbacterium azadirachtae]